MISRYEQFAALISGIERGIQRIERDEMEKLGYKGAYAQYLAALRRCEGGVTAARLCEICDRDKAAVSRMVGELEQKGLVNRESGASYRACLTLTEKGRTVAELVCRKAQAAVDAGGAGLTEEERRIYFTALERIAGNIESISREGLPDNEE
ncbi:MAG: MarR family transcriptional regulator [Clostridia bacterium]|nr:MarR family transcriptional regulator [Clostridia bacterium]